MKFHLNYSDKFGHNNSEISLKSWWYFNEIVVIFLWNFSRISVIFRQNFSRISVIFWWNSARILTKFISSFPMKFWWNFSRILVIFQWNFVNFFTWDVYTELYPWFGVYFTSSSINSLRYKFRLFCIVLGPIFTIFRISSGQILWH